EKDEFWKTWALAILYHAAERQGDSEEALRVLADENADGNAYQIAEVHSMRGEIDQAFGWLDRAVESRDPGVTHSKANPRLRALHEDPRWPGLMAKIGLDVSD